MKSNRLNILFQNGITREQLWRRLLSIGRVAFAFACAIVTLLGVFPIRRAYADSGDRNQQILPFPTITASTLGSNGDVNPYGVAFVPDYFPAGGSLNPGDILVSNFNNNQNLQGTGSTIVRVTPTGQVTTFFAGTQPIGLSTGLAVLKAGFVLVGNCPTNNQLPVPGSTAGSILLIDSAGHLVTTYINPAIQGPWDFTVQDEGARVKVFVSNVVNGTVTRIDLELSGGTFVIKSAVVIAFNYPHRVDPITFEVGPTGVAYDAENDVLYVASTGDNSVFAVANAGKGVGVAGEGRLVYKDDVHLHGALAMVMAPNGHLLVSNSDGINPDPNQPSEIVEFTVRGEFIGQLSVDPNEGGAFGLNIVKISDDEVRFAAVDDNTNTITIWELRTSDLPSASGTSRALQ